MSVDREALEAAWTATLSATVRTDSINRKSFEAGVEAYLRAITPVGERGVVKGWREAINRVRDQLGQAGGTGTAGAQNSITEREVGGWVLDAVDDELSALEPIPPSPVRVSEEIEAARIAKKRLETYADAVNAGEAQGGGREFKRRIWAAFSDFEALSLPAGETEGETR